MLAHAYLAATAATCRNPHRDQNRDLSRALVGLAPTAPGTSPQPHGHAYHRWVSEAPIHRWSEPLAT
jgi:hypothetical protein